ncbi:hypothetical protein [Anaplasma bovis]|uniref:hypothetical protein n=1 Tax=Anaplasma bovis TaxID=186733 RepID=UPI002FF417AF
MLNAVAPRVLRSFTMLLSRKVSSGRPPSVSRPVVLLEDILSDLANEGDVASGSEKDVTSVYRNDSVDSAPIRAGVKLCSKNCSGCPRSAANSKLKNKVKVEEQLHAQKVKEEKGEESGRVYGPLLEDSFVARVSGAIDARFRTR